MLSTVDQPAELARRLLAGDRLALSRAISWAEARDPRFAEALAALWPKVGRAWRTGITGAPGTGKSTLVNALIGALRGRGRTVGVVAVDPSSPTTGGALLGDRIRMEERTADAGVFIRSMASRGSHGGLAQAAVDACDAMDAFGLTEILVETVGVGQAEFDVASAADTLVVVAAPGAGDAIQAQKSGLLELADVVVVNKSDLPEAERTAAELEDGVRLRRARGDGWRAPVALASAARGLGIDQVLGAIDSHRRHLEARGLGEARRVKRAAQIRRAVEEGLAASLWGENAQGASDARLPAAPVAQRVAEALASGATPYDVAGAIVAAAASGARAALADGGSARPRVPPRVPGERS